MEEISLWSKKFQALWGLTTITTPSTPQTYPTHPGEANLTLLTSSTHTPTPFTSGTSWATSGDVFLVTGFAVYAPLGGFTVLRDAVHRDLISLFVGNLAWILEIFSSISLEDLGTKLNPEVSISSRRYSSNPGGVPPSFPETCKV
jgi:hypothetical protein